MEESLVKAAEREMRRPAPQQRPAKRQRSSPADGREEDAQEQAAFQELGRFEYAAADSLASGAQGFLLTCGFRREKSATREAVGVLSEVIGGLGEEGGVPKFSIMKLPVRGVVLLLWQRSLGQPRPVAVVAEVITSIHARKRKRLKFVQRMMPMEAACMLEASALRKAVAQLAADMAADTCKGAAQEAGHNSAALDTAVTSGKCEAAPLPTLRFAVAWRSRSAAEHTPAASTGERAVAVAKQAESADDEPSQGNGDAAEGGCSDLERRQCVSNDAERHGSGKVAEGDSRGTFSRSAILAAAASAFVEGLAGVRAAVVDLKQPEWVLLVEGVPVSKQVLCALSIVSCELISLKPKMQMLSVGG